MPERFGKLGLEKTLLNEMFNSSIIIESLTYSIHSKKINS